MAGQYDGGMPNKARALALSTHPGPSATVAAVAVLLGVGVGLDAGRVALVGLTVLANQLSIGWSNDWLDAERDRAVGRGDKPVAQGLISARAVRAAAWTAVVASVILSLPLGTAATAANALFIASGWAYNAGVKNTPFSAVPYAVGFGALPLIVTFARSEPGPAAWWAVAAGSALGVAAHFANVLPDLEDDRRTGIRGLPHRLGRTVAGVSTYLILAAASALVVFGRGSPPGAVLWAGFIATLALAGAGVYLVLVKPPTRRLFQLIIAAALVNVALLALSGGQIVA